MGIRFRSAGGNGRVVTSHTMTARDTKTGKVYRAKVRMNRPPQNFDGLEPPPLLRCVSTPFAPGVLFTAHIRGVPTGSRFVVGVHAWNGRKGPGSVPIVCNTPEGSLFYKPWNGPTIEYIG